MSASPNHIREIDRVVLFGVGLLGGSIGLALRQSGWAGRLIGLGRRQSTLDAALQAGCIDEGTADAHAALAGGGLVIVCTPVSAVSQALSLIAQHAPPGTVVTDVASTKRQVCDAAADLLPQPNLFVPAHPMAGGEMHGPEHARAGLFVGRPCILTPAPTTDPSAIALVESLWTTLGLRLVHMDADEADRQAARISHLPHAVAMMLVELADRMGGLDVASTGFRDTTRVASGDPQIWRDIFSSNRQGTVESIDAFIAAMQSMRDLLDTGDDDGLKRLLTHCKTVRDQWVQQRFVEP